MTGRIQLAIVGWPVDHSLSPEIWEWMAARRGIALEYGRLAVRPKETARWNSLWTSELDGFNVTAPLKDRAAARCDRTLGVAARIQAVNTAIRRGDTWEGHSTDGYGFVRSVLARGEPLAERSLAVLGTGGAGRSVAVAAAAEGARVTLVSRAPSRLPPGCEELSRIDWEAFATTSEPFDILVNATPLGKDPAGPPPPLPYDRCCEGVLVVDLNYDSPTTGFLRAAREAGARAVVNGIGTLVHQACLGAALVIDGDPSAAESYEADFAAAARAVRSGDDG